MQSCLQKASFPLFSACSSSWEPTSLSLTLRQWEVLVAALPVPQGPFPLSVAAVVGRMWF